MPLWVTVSSRLILRIQLAEVPEDGRELAQRQLVGRAEPEPAAHRRAGEVGDGFVLRREDGPGEAGHRLAVVGERDCSGVAEHELPPAGLLQSANLLGDRRLTEAELTGRSGEAQGRRHRQKRPQQLGVEVGLRHASRASYWSMIECQI